MACGWSASNAELSVTEMHSIFHSCSYETWINSV